MSAGGVRPGGGKQECRRAGPAWRGGKPIERREDHGRVAGRGIIGGADPADGQGRDPVSGQAGRVRAGGHRHLPRPRPARHEDQARRSATAPPGRYPLGHRLAVGGKPSFSSPLYGLGLVGRDLEQVTEITRAPGDRGGHTTRLGVLVHIAALPADHVVSYRGVPLTSVPRTVIDLARTLPFAEGVAVADSALNARLTSKGRARRRHRGLPAMAGPAAGPPGNRVQRCPSGVGAGVPQPGRLSPAGAAAS